MLYIIAFVLGIIVGGIYAHIEFERVLRRHHSAILDAADATVDASVHQRKL